MLPTEIERLIEYYTKEMQLQDKLDALLDRYVILFQRYADTTRARRAAGLPVYVYPVHRFIYCWNTHTRNMDDRRKQLAVRYNIPNYNGAWLHSWGFIFDQPMYNLMRDLLETL